MAKSSQEAIIVIQIKGVDTQARMVSVDMRSVWFWEYTILEIGKSGMTVNEQNMQSIKKVI